MVKTLNHILLFTVACLLFAVAGANAQNRQPRDWTALGQEVLEQRQRVQTLNEEERRLLDEIDRVGFTLDALKREHDAIKAETGTIEKDLAALSKKIAVLEKDAAQSLANAEKSLVRLYKARTMGNISVLASANSLLNLSLRQKVMAGLLAKDRETVEQVAQTLKGLKATQTEMADMRAYKNKKMDEAKAKLKEVEDARAQNKKLLAGIAKEKDMQLAALKYMEASQQQLDAEMLKLNAENLKLKQAVAAKPSGGVFSASKGLLIMPVKGKITNKFGAYKPPGENVELFRKGVDIAARPGDYVNAVFAGTIVYADWFKGYGNMVIIDHGDGYFTVYARLGKLFKSRDMVVLGGEALGEVNSDSGISGSALYFEIRHHAKPLDPAVWLAKK